MYTRHMTDMTEMGRSLETEFGHVLSYFCPDQGEGREFRKLLEGQGQVLAHSLLSWPLQDFYLHWWPSLQSSIASSCPAPFTGAAISA